METYGAVSRHSREAGGREYAGESNRGSAGPAQRPAADLLLNEIIRRSVRGPDSPMPAPKRAAFVFAHPAKDDDD